MFLIDFYQKYYTFIGPWYRGPWRPAINEYRGSRRHWFRRWSRRYSHVTTVRAQRPATGLPGFCLACAFDPGEYQGLHCTRRKGSKLFESQTAKGPQDYTKLGSQRMQIKTWWTRPFVYRIEQGVQWTVWTNPKQAQRDPYSRQFWWSATYKKWQ